MNINKKIIKETVKKELENMFLIKEYTNNNYGEKINGVIIELENIKNEILSDIDNQNKNGNIMVSRNEIEVKDLMNAIEILKRANRRINRTI